MGVPVVSQGRRTNFDETLEIEMGEKEVLCLNPSKSKSIGEKFNWDGVRQVLTDFRLARAVFVPFVKDLVRLRGGA